MLPEVFNGRVEIRCRSRCEAGYDLGTMRLTGHYRICGENSMGSAAPGSRHSPAKARVPGFHMSDPHPRNTIFTGNLSAI